MGVFPDGRTAPHLIRHLQTTIAGKAVAGLEINLQVARVRKIDTQLADLGSLSNSATNVPIQLPEIDLVELRTFVQARARVIEIGLTVAVLQRLTGQSYGADPAAWAAWYRDNKTFVVPDLQD